MKRRSGPKNLPLSIVKPAPGDLRLVLAVRLSLAFDTTGYGLQSGTSRSCRQVGAKSRSGGTCYLAHDKTIEAQSHNRPGAKP